jgi:hypothetical protein
MVWLPTEIPTIEEEDELTKGLQKKLFGAETYRHRDALTLRREHLDA